MSDVESESDPPSCHKPPPNGLGTLELLFEASRQGRLPWDERELLKHVAWVWAQRTAACPDGMKTHSLKQIYDDLNLALHERGNALVWDHKHHYFKEQHPDEVVDGACSWRIEQVMDNCAKYDEGYCHGGVVEYAYVDSHRNHNTVDWTTYDDDLHCVRLVLYTGEKVNKWCSRSVSIYLYASENGQYIALSNRWAVHSPRKDEPMPTMYLARIQGPSVFEMATFCPKFNTSNMTVYNTQRLLLHKFIVHKARAPDRDACWPFDILQETMWRRAMDAKENYRKALGIEKMEDAFYSWFALPAGAMADSMQHTRAHSLSIRTQARLVLMRWVSAFRMRKLRKELDVMKSNYALLQDEHAAKRKRKDA
jgi:hypothetical protein